MRQSDLQLGLMSGLLRLFVLLSCVLLSTAAVDEVHAPDDGHDHHIEIVDGCVCQFGPSRIESCDLFLSLLFRIQSTRHCGC